MQNNVKGLPTFAITLLIFVATVSSASANFATPAAPRNFGILYVDSRSAAPVVRHQYIHFTPPLSPFLTVTNFTSEDNLLNHGGITVANLSQYDLYVNCPSTCWASPSGFEARMGLSAMIHIVDQYVGRNGSYTHGGSAQVSYANNHILYDPDIWKIVSTFVKKFHTPIGYAGMYHVFLKKGTDVCDDTRNRYTGCYAPDGAKKNVFCAYHSAVDIPTIGHVLYSVEPYQDVNGCRTPSPWPNGVLADSTFSILSHELFETITDPDGDAWYGEEGEIGDVCRLSYDTVTLYNHQYKIQGEYSNRITNCAW